MLVCFCTGIWHEYNQLDNLACFCISINSLGWAHCVPNTGLRLGVRVTHLQNQHTMGLVHTMGLADTVGSVHIGMAIIIQALTTSSLLPSNRTGTCRVPGNRSSSPVTVALLRASCFQTGAMRILVSSVKSATTVGRQKSPQVKVSARCSGLS